MSSQLQHKLLHYEVPPPEGVWDKVAASLDKNNSLAFPEKLYRYEEKPSSFVWETISAQLDAPIAEKAKIIPFHIRYRKALKYSGAVAVFIFLAILTNLFISKKTESELSPRGVANASVKKSPSKSSDTSKEDDTAAELTGKNKPEHLIAGSKLSKIRQEEYQDPNSSFESFLPQQAEKNEIVNSSLSAEKYMMYSDDDGNVVRLPKKIFNAFACPTDDMICKQRLQQLREKFAQSAMTADFTGLLQILKSLQENQ